MICDLCAKNNATVHLTEIIDDQMTELHLCESCARKKSAQMEQQFGLSDLLAAMAEFGKGPAELKEETLKCTKCGLAYDEFKKRGRLGCGECYTAFSRYLDPLLKKIHGSNRHIGKSTFKLRPAEARVAGRKPDIEELREKLQQAIDAEAFEEAAKIRDEIKALEKKTA